MPKKKDCFGALRQALAVVGIVLLIWWAPSVGPQSWRSSVLSEWEVANPRHPELLEIIRRSRLVEWEPEDLWDPPNKKGWIPCPISSPLVPAGTIGYLQVFLEGGLNQQRIGICDAVAVAKILNATLLLPHLEVNPVWQDSSMFADIFDVDHFISYLKNDVHIIKELPYEYSWSTREYYATGIRVTRVKDTPLHAGLDWYRTKLLPVIRSYGIAAVSPFTHRLGFEGLPTSIQQLRCRVNFEALRFVPLIRSLGDSIIDRLHSHSWNSRRHMYSSVLEANEEEDSRVTARAPAKYMSVHLRFDKDMAAHSACDFGGGKAEIVALAKYREEVWQGRVRNTVYTTNEVRENGKCPLTPEEVAIMLAALGFGPKTRLYLASYKVYGGEARLAHLRSLFPLMEDKYDLATEEELMPLKGKASLLAALDFHVSLHSDTFISASNGNMRNALVGHRTYRSKGKTIRPDFVLLARLYANKSPEWEEFEKAVRKGHRNRMGQILMRQSYQSIYTYPAPDCMCSAVLLGIYSRVDKTAPRIIFP